MVRTAKKFRSVEAFSAAYPEGTITIVRPWDLHANGLLNPPLDAPEGFLLCPLVLKCGSNAFGRRPFSQPHLHPTAMTFTAKLNARIDAVDSMLCVGLDPDLNRIPQCLRNHDDPVYDFCRAIVDATAPYVCAFKPQIAYFAANGSEKSLEKIMAYCREQHPEIPVILDAKRGDIGSTAKQYAKEAFVRYGADAVTLSPYMGFDTIEPYFEYADRGVIILCRTSNPGGADIEELNVGGETVYEHIARLAAGPWNKTGQIGLVVGATQPAEIARVRALAPEVPLLVPGIGAQGGDVNAAVAAGLDTYGRGMIINSSRAVIFAGSDENFAQAAGQAARATRDAIRAAKVAVRG